jgi:hypothetical protein
VRIVARRASAKKRDKAEGDKAESEELHALPSLMKGV